MTEPLKLLYVDDDADIRTIVEMSLGLDPTISTRMAASGREALAIAVDPAWRPDAFVLDMMMPDMDGMATARALRGLPGLAAIPTVFMTARGRDEDVARFCEEGAVGVVLKPFDPLQLAAQIRAMLDVRPDVRHRSDQPLHPRP